MSNSTTTSHAASPTNYPSTGTNPDEGLFSLDFLALAGLDSGMSNEITSPSNSINSGNNHHHGHGGHGQKDITSNHSIQQQIHQWEHNNNHAGPSTLSQTSSATVTRDPSLDTETEHSAGRRNKGGNNEDASNSMDLDQPEIGRSTQQEGFHSGIDTGGGGGGDPGGGVGQEYDALQAALLQQQLQAIHMQSPLGFDINNPQFPLAQMFLSSPGAQMAQLQQFMQNEVSGPEGQRPRHRGSIDKHWAAGMGGMPTPGPSGELIPQSRQEAMSPMHLEMLARAQSEFGGDPNMLPLLSPALSHSTSTSFNSPSTQVAFNSQPPSGHLNSNGANKSPLEQLQEQQRQFQEQLAVLQQRQLEMQATAAAVVAASSNSPFIGSNPSSAGPSRAATTPGVTPNSSFFSPLTSPALEASNRMQQQHMHRQHFSPAFNTQQSRTPHPLSALSSPALNPVGSSGGAQQTLSPALGPQTGADLSDPDYLRALVGMLDGDPQNIGQPAQQVYHSPSIASSSSAGHSTILASPALIPTNSSGTGPHRHSLPAKSRPSPMLKPTNHRSHQRIPSGTPIMNANGAYSVPTSPAIQKFHPNPPQSGMVNMGYLPPSAIDHRNLAPAPSGASMSSASTPSPVDLSHIMPPPPVPSSNSSSKSKKGGVAPMTPASLMNLSSAPVALENSPVNDRQDNNQNNHSGVVPPPAPPKKGSTSNAGRNTRKQKANNNNTTAPAAGKKASGSKLVPVGGGTGGGKRALAIRPQSAAASRAAAKPPPPPTEPENRKTSHKAAEQKRRDSLKAGFDELRLLLPPINVEALDPESGEPIPGSSAPRLLPKSSLVPDDNPNRGVSKVALLRFGNEYIERLKERVDRRDDYIERLRDEVRKLRTTLLGGDQDEDEGNIANIDDDDDDDGDGDINEKAELNGDGDDDILEFDWREGEEEEFDPPSLLDEDILLDDSGDPLDGSLDENGQSGENDEEMDVMENRNQTHNMNKKSSNTKNSNGKRSKSFSSSSNNNSSTTTKSPALKAVNGRRPSLIRGTSSSATVTTRK
ncbi:uncharacterized protein L201_000078 [Kwoniella dendrophila CBS 6074]|uniref:BHLH domain-containing protein n=1 Tax=Kwoniella dendrophila CBS 6074 TaxID=1295534 RepID=A0AAX4JK09_9TREE